MTAATRIVLAGTMRRPGQAFVRLLVITVAVALLGSMLLFISDSLRTMTDGAVRAVPIDWQAPAPSEGVATAGAVDAARQRGIAHAEAIATAPFASALHHSSAGDVQAGSGSVLAVGPGYMKAFPTIRMLHGRLVEGQVVLDQQLAATLQATVGDEVLLTPAEGVEPQPFRVSGVALVGAADTLFQRLDPVLGPAPAQPPAEIAILPLKTFAATIGSMLPAARPSTTADVQPGAQSGVAWQVVVQLHASSLRGSPQTALKTATGIRNRVERSLPGRLRFVDNLAEGLTGAANDALYAGALYVMLALPGAIVGLGLAYLAALGVAERDRRDAALLRARGATRRQLLLAAALESMLAAVVAGVLGALLALACVRLVVGHGIPLHGWRGPLILVACMVLGFLGAFVARVSSLSTVLRRPIAESRSGMVGRRAERPLWQRLYLDVVALAISALSFWLTLRTGFSAVVNPDSNPTITLAGYMFLAPALLWIGATLLLVRLRGRGLGWLVRWAGRLSRRARGAPGLPTFVLASIGRRSSQVNRGLVVTALILAFGVELGIFAATYDQQAKVDAQLTLGGDVAVTAPDGAIRQHRLVSSVEGVGGIDAATGIDHDHAYVGPDLQDLFGIDASTIARATTLRDYYFLGGTARQVLDRLRARPDGVLVSRETITDYQLQVDDLLRLRVLDRRSGMFRVARFHVVGVVQEFPSAPKDSFMVANVDYLESQTHASGPNLILASASGDPRAAARGVRRATARFGTSVADIRSQQHVTTSSITTVSLRGVTAIEEAFAIGLAACAMILVVVLAAAERRTELAVMAAVGTPLREIAAFLWSEAAIVLMASLALAAALGWTLAWMLVAMLQHVFDPPPDRLAIPWPFLGLLAAAAVGGFLVALLVARLLLARLPLGAILREEG